MAFSRYIAATGIWCGIGIGLAGCTETLETLPTPEPSGQAVCDAGGDFVFIPAGEYVAGSDRTERDYGYQISAEAIVNPQRTQAEAEAQLRQRRWFDAEPNRQQSTLPAFCMGQNLITNADYQAFIQATGHRTPGISEADYQTQGFLVHPYAAVQPFLWQSDRYPEGQANHPVVLVSYEDVLAYARWRGAEQTGGTYRLPTADEWEKVARGDDGRYFPWGNDWQETATNWQGSREAGTSAVATYPLSRSLYGVEDMAGNVFEYTSTLASGGQRAVMKGCAWDDLPGFCRAAYRHTRPIESRHILFGFRLVWVPDN
ncbi:MAG: SUMF1/EgtB/PvdO family nonheme iron enzyme [Cyanobacteria bacterium P01_G01_bin.38]